MNQLAINSSARNRGSATAIVIGVVVVVVVAGLGLYFFSPFWQQKVDSGVRDFTQWTPERIAAEPVLYLDFCEKQSNQALEKIEASKISIAQRKAKLEQMKEESDTYVKKGEQILKQLKELNAEAKANDSWPVTFNGNELTKEKFAQQVKRIRTDYDNKKKTLKAAEDGLKKLEATSNKLIEAKSEIETQLSQIESNREMLKVKEITGDITDQLVDMRGVLAAATSIADSGEGEIMGIGDVIESEGVNIDDEEVDNLLADF
ncbi:MAG: hypothetical protein MI741_16380 [Rhodospirillales bacterium]|nr:hypothetical protein [Rhodospirillales bacterium]